MSCATDFDRKGLNDLPLVGGLCLVQRTSTTKGLNDLPLVGGLCLVQRTLTAKGLNDLPLIGGFCLVQRTLTTKGLNDLPLIGGLCLVPIMDTMGHRIQTGASQREQQYIQGIRECITLMKVEDFAFDLSSLLGCRF